MKSDELKRYDGQKLYKYYSYNVCMQEMFLPFLRKTLRYKKCKAFNDPYDCYIAAKTGREIKSVRDSQMENVHVCCLTVSRDDILMWSHYASNHTGFVVEYDVREMVNVFLSSPYRMEKSFFSVGYSNDIKTKTLLSSNMQINESELLQAIFHKYSGWEYEREVRSVIYELTTNDFIDLPINEKCISSIILGCNFIAKCNGKVPKFLRDLNDDKKLYYMQLCSDKYELELKSNLEDKWFENAIDCETCRS